jgi:hypothetical protein
MKEKTEEEPVPMPVNQPSQRSSLSRTWPTGLGTKPSSTSLAATTDPVTGAPKLMPKRLVTTNSCDGRPCCGISLKNRLLDRPPLDNHAVAPSTTYTPSAQILDRQRHEIELGMCLSHVRTPLLRSSIY